MDWPYRICGREHRRYFHDPASAAVVVRKCYPGEPDTLEVAYLHILLDQLCSDDPVFKTFLQKLALLDKRTRRRRKTKTEKLWIL